MSSISQAHELDSRPVPSPATGRLGGFTRRILAQQEVVTGFVAIALVIFFTVDSPYFFTTANAATLAAYIAPIAFFAVAEVLILILGEIDLSVGEMYVLSPFLVEHLNNVGVPIPVGLVLAILICGGLGLVNGLVTVKLHVPSFITTLGMTFAVEGVILIGSNGAPATPVGTGTLTLVLGGATWAEAYWILGLVGVMHVVLRGTTFGLHTVAVGGNQEASRESGIRVDAVKIWCFVLCSLMGGLIGILDGYHIGSIDPDTDGLSFMFYGVSAAVIGGTALTGGRGTMIGAFIGAAVLGILEDGFHIISISSFAYDLILGLAIVFAMVLNVQIERAGTRRHGSFARAINQVFGRRRRGSARS
jgi:simple sugar transport system permease protein